MYPAPTAKMATAANQSLGTAAYRVINPGSRSRFTMSTRRRP